MKKEEMKNYESPLFKVYEVKHHLCQAVSQGNSESLTEREDGYNSNDFE